MKPLSRASLNYLLMMVRFRDRPVTLWGQVRANLLLFTLTAACIGTMGVAVYATSGPVGSALICGMLLGMIARDIGNFRRAAALWPVTQQILDWRRINELLADDGANGGSEDGAGGSGERWGGRGVADHADGP